MKKNQHLLPGLKPNKVTYEYYQEYTPEKFELIEGLMFGDEEAVKKLALLLMYNIGLEETIKLAPKELWERAMNNLC